MRAAFSNALVQFAKDNPRVLLLTGDHGYALFDAFRQQCPQQYINAGIAEQNMVGMAAGLARAGFIPFVYGLSAFIPIRVLEQIKLDIAHDQLHVVLLGDGAGFVYSHLGTSHQSTEDIAAARAIPHLNVLSPADRHEQTLCMQWALACKAPVYMRMGKSDRGDVHAGPLQAPLGDMLPLQIGSPQGLTFIATGSMARTALEVAAANPQSNVWSVPAIKPLNVAQLLQACRHSRGVVTLEEHAVRGGLGAMVAEETSAVHPVRILRIGTADRFSAHCGDYDYLLREHGLDSVSVAQKVQAFAASL